MKKYITALIFGMALLSVSCVKEDDKIGQLIQFSAASEFQNGVETRTIYSGEDNITVGGNRYERINWISGDDMYILYKHGSASNNAIYNVSTITSNTGNKKSTASVGLASGETALEWKDGTPTFYAVYPATYHSVTGFPAISGETAPSVNSSGQVSTCKIPTVQTVVYDRTDTDTNTGLPIQDVYLPDMRRAYMVSYAAGSQISGDRVTLPFSPAVTALEFKLKLGSNTSSLDVQSAQLQSSSSALSGDYTVSILGYDDVNERVNWSAATSGTTSSHVTVNFQNGTTPRLKNSSYLNFTVFVLPVGSISGLSLLIKYSDGTIKELSMSGLSLTAGRKYIVTNDTVPNLDYDYYITSINDILLATGHTGGSQSITVQSYKQDKTNSNNKKPVPWKMQYSADDGTTWTDLPSAGYQNFTASALSGSGASIVNNALSSETSTITLSGTSTSTTHISCPAGLKANTYGDSSNRWDLSKNGLSNSANAINTANCYIVTGPGEYMFPVVYGNAIKGSTTNTSAFAPMNASSDGITQTEAPFITHLSDVNTTFNTTGYPANYYLPEFWNVNAGAISSPFIATDLSVGSSWEPIVVWQDVPDGDEIIPYSSGYIGTTTGTIGNTSNVAYIWFKIDADHIKPGNIVIAMKGTGSTVNYILWSWHIWIPEETPSASNSFMNRNLGQVTQVPVTDYAARSLKFRILQTETGGTYEDFTVTQNAHQTTGSSETRNTYYQWGRKDPMLNTNSADYVSLNPDLNLTRANVFTSFQGWNFSTNDIDRGRGIRAPYWLLQNSKTHSWMDGNVYPNFSSITTEARYYIKSPSDSQTNNPDGSDHKKMGPFTATQKSSLSTTQFVTNGDTWTKVKDAGWYVKDNRTIKSTGYTTEEKEWIARPYYLPPGTYYSTISGWFNLTVYAYADAQGTNGFTWLENPYYCLSASDFSQSGSTWNYSGSKKGPFTADQTVYLNSIGYNNGVVDPTSGASAFEHWDYYAEALYNYSGTFYYGPYNSTSAGIMLSNGFTQNDFWGENVTTSTPYATVTERNESSIVYNLWNSYIYAQDTQGKPYVNKFKTVYDPCPPGYTVPTRTLANDATWNADSFPSRGALPNVSSNYDVSGYTYNVNGYWTDHPLGIKPTGANVDLTDLSNYQDYDKAYMKVVGESGNAEKLRSTAASIRPMTDPKFSGSAPALSPAAVSGSSIESVTNGNSLY